MIEQVLKRKNLYQACREVVRNHWHGPTEIAILGSNRDRIILSVLNRT